MAECLIVRYFVDGQTDILIDSAPDDVRIEYQHIPGLVLEGETNQELKQHKCHYFVFKLWVWSHQFLQLRILGCELKNKFYKKIF